MKLSRAAAIAYACSIHHQFTNADLNGNKKLNPGPGTSNRMLITDGSQNTQFTSVYEVQTQVKTYCQNPVNYDTSKYGEMQLWDVSRVTSMAFVFHEVVYCDIPDISAWNVSQVTDFQYMFGESSFNKGIGNWDVSKGTHFRNMFTGAVYFNQDIGNWDVSKGTNFFKMFCNTPYFNKGIGNWDVSKGTHFSYMFSSARNFNQDIGNWDVSKGTNFHSMFYNTPNFNQNIGNWDVSKSTHFDYMFHRALSFNQNIGNWDVSKSEQFFHMFDRALSFNQNIGNWDVSKSTNFDYILYEAHNFEQNLNTWLTWINKRSSNYWCDGGAVCDQGLTFTPTLSRKPSAAPTNYPTKSSAPSVNPLLVTASDRVTEASLYKLAYKLDVPNNPDFQHNVPYSLIDALPDELAIARIAYYMQLINEKHVIQWVWVSMDPFTQIYSKIGVPTFDSEAIFQQEVSNLNIKSSLADINDYVGSGNIEFWPNNYHPNNKKVVKGANDGIYDWGDEISEGGTYGSMQVHVPDLSTTVFAFNRWNSRSSPDIGIGNAPYKHTDWTFSQTGQSYVIKRLEVFVRTL